MGTPKLLDLYCCQGGASQGYADAGWAVVGVDTEPQPRYPFRFAQADALEFFANHAHEYQAWHASPPCQAHSLAQRIQGRTHRDFISITRQVFREANAYRRRSGVFEVPWVIENVPGAPLENPIELCGAMFGIETYRHRLFETNFQVEVPEHPVHMFRTTKMGRRPVEGEFMHIVGNFTDPERARRIMSMPWASRDGLREAIPPVYAEHIGRQMLAHLEAVAA